MTSDDYCALVDGGILGKVELTYGRIRLSLFARRRQASVSRTLLPRHLGQWSPP